MSSNIIYDEESDLYYYVFEIDSDILEELQEEITLSFDLSITVSGDSIISSEWGLERIDFVA